jgi:hypothetical protein
MSLLMDLQTATAYRRMGILAREDLPDIATEALLRGEDTESLRLLAGLTPVETDQAWDLFDRAVEELRLDLPDDLAAARVVTASIARQASTGEIGLHDGIRRLSAVCGWLRWQPPESMACLVEAFHLVDVLDEPRKYPFSEEEVEQWCRDVIELALMGD